MEQPGDPWAPSATPPAQAYSAHSCRALGQGVKPGCSGQLPHLGLWDSTLPLRRPPPRGLKPPGHGGPEAGVAEQLRRQKGLRGEEGNCAPRGSGLATQPCLVPSAHQTGPVPLGNADRAPPGSSPPLALLAAPAQHPVGSPSPLQSRNPALSRGPTVPAWPAQGREPGVQDPSPGSEKAQTGQSPQEAPSGLAEGQPLP